MLYYIRKNVEKMTKKSENPGFQAYKTQKTLFSTKTRSYMDDHFYDEDFDV